MVPRQRGDGTADRGSIKNVEDLKNIKDRKLYNEMKSAISRFYKELGIPQRKVKLADMKKSWLGVHVTQNGKSEGVYLNKKHFKNKTAEQVAAKIKSGYDSKFHTKTNKPVAHTITHELAHSVWNDKMTGPRQKSAGRLITKVYNQWKKDKSKTGYGTYAGTNVNEFWAETITKGIHGKADKYTKALKDIAKMFRL
jgi:hypothetical protein